MNCKEGQLKEETSFLFFQNEQKFAGENIGHKKVLL